MPTDKKTIETALKLWFRKGDVFEIRVLDAVSTEWMRPHMESGYFDYDHIPDAADAIGRLRSYRGAYATVNPVNPDLLARACNRLRGITREPTTSDSDILSRRWLLIDCDPKRVSGVSSSDSEHEAALSMACKIRDGLFASGWPDPIIQDSGNGAQMMYRIDLPPDDGDLVQRCIAGIATAGDDEVDVDLTVFNPARIWRIPGTMNCKGDDVPTRPHRMAQILSVPEKKGVVTAEQMEAVARWKPIVTADNAIEMDEPGFDLDSWIRQYCPELGEPQVWKDGRKWVFPICPFNDAHRNRSGVLIQHSSGAIIFRCHHNSCAGNDWFKLRELRQPGCYDHRKTEYPDVDISGILNQKPKSQKTAETPPVPAKKDIAEDFTDPGKMQDKLLNVPGFLNDFTEFSLGCAPKPNRVLSFCGALAFLSYLVGRHVTDERNNRPNIYLIALANSGVGKEQPRRINMAVATATDPKLCDGLADTFASGEGLEDALFMNHTMLFQVDEMDTLLNSMKAKDPRAEGLIGKMLKIFTASASFYKLRNLAVPRSDLAKMKESQRNGTPGRHSDVIQNPYLVIFGTAIPQLFYQALDQRFLTNGLTARCLILEAGERGKKNKSCIIKVPENIIRSVKIITSYGGEGNLSDVNPQPMMIPATEEANVMLDELDDKYDAIYDKYCKRNALVPMSFWARAFEKVCKLSQLYAVSANLANPVIDKAAVTWASQFVEYLTKQTLFLSKSYSFENPFDEKCQKALRYIREAGGTYQHAALLKRMHESAEVFRKIIDTLRENDSISVEIDPSSVTKNAVIYRLK